MPFPHKNRPVRALAAAASIAALLLLAPGFARAQDEAEDLLLQYDPATQQLAVVPKTPGANIFNRTMERLGTSGPFINDSGFDVFPSIDNDPPYEGRNIRQATLVQLGISQGLSAVYQYDGVTPVFGQTSATNFRWTIAETKGPGAAPPQALPSDAGDPFFLHQHFDFSTSLSGTFTFDFRFEDVILTDGTVLSNPSPTYRINFRTADSAVAPEPGAGALLTLGGLLPCALGIVSRRRKKNG